MNFPPDHAPHLWEAVPEHLRGGLNAYIMLHRRPGGFLSHVLRNDLHAAVMTADPESRAALPDICLYLYNCAPGGCWGGDQAFNDWLAKAPRV